MSHQSLCPGDLSVWYRTRILPRWSPSFSWGLILLSEDVYRVCRPDSPAGAPHGVRRLLPGELGPSGTLTWRQPGEGAQPPSFLVPEAACP